MNISAPFVRRPIATSLLMMAIALGGFVAFRLLPVAPLPQVDFPTISISASLPGASPETMATAVAQPLERQFGQVAGITQMTSTSTLGATSVTLQFELNRDIDAAAQDVQAAISAATRQLPDDLPSPPTYRKVNPADSPILVMGVHSDSLPLTLVDDYADTILAQQISQISGVSQVSIGGEQKPAVRVQIDPAKLATKGLTLEDVRGVIASATVNSAKGTLNGAVQSFTIAANDQLAKASDYNDVVIAYRNGAPVRVRDVGEAVDGPENLYTGAWDNNKRAVLLVVSKQPGANVIETVDRIKDALPRLQAVIPPDVTVDILSDRTETIRASVDDVEVTLGLTIVLVVLVILLFLRNLRVTLIPGVVVPLSLLGATATMYLLGFSLDNISLMALTISVGFVVDDAIVVVENIYRYIEDGVPPLEAALTGSREIGFTVMSISLSLVAVFIPLLLMGGIIGRLFREFSITVTAAIAVSAFVSLALTPMLCARFLHHKTVSHGRVYTAIEAVFDGMLGFYRRTLDGVLRHQFLTLLVFLATMAISIYLFVVIPKGFFPIQDTGLVTGFAEFGAGHLPARDVAHDGQARRGGRGRPRCGRVRIGDGKHGQRANSQHRPFLHRTETARSAHGDGDGYHQSAAAEPRAGRGCQPRAAAVTRHHGRRAYRPGPVPVHAARRRPCRAERLGAEDPGETTHAARTRRRLDRSAEQNAAARHQDQSRSGGAFRHLAASDRRDAQ